MRSFTKVLQAQWGQRPAAEIDGAAERLVDEARAASKLRGYLRDANVLALNIERTRERTERGLVAAMLLMLLFTTWTVQQFVASGTDHGSLGWWLAFGVEPGIVLVVFMLMRQDQVARREGVIPGPWLRSGRWLAFVLTYLMNTATSFGAWDWRGIFLHSALPLLAFWTAEALTNGRDALTSAADKVTQGPEANRIWPPPVPKPEPTEVPFVVSPETLPVPAVAPDGDDGGDDTDASDIVIPLTRLPKGHLKNVRLPEVLRELRAQGRVRDEITTAEVDTLLPATKYVTRAMINSAWAVIEEEVDGGAVNA